MAVAVAVAAEVDHRLLSAVAVTAAPFERSETAVVAGELHTQILSAASLSFAEVAAVASW